MIKTTPETIFFKTLSRNRNYFVRSHNIYQNVFSGYDMSLVNHWHGGVTVRYAGFEAYLCADVGETLKADTICDGQNFTGRFPTIVKYVHSCCTQSYNQPIFKQIHEISQSSGLYFHINITVIRWIHLCDQGLPVLCRYDYPVSVTGA